MANGSGVMTLNTRPHWVKDQWVKNVKIVFDHNCEGQNGKKREKVDYL